MASITNIKKQASLQNIVETYYREITGQLPSSDDIPENLLRRTINFLRNIIRQSPGHIYWLDSSNVYLGCNDIQAHNVGLNTPDQIINKTNHDLPWKNQADALDELNNKVMQTKQRYKAEEFAVTVDHPDGGYYLSEKKPLLNENGDVIGILGVSLDITELKKAETALTKAKEAAEVANTAKTEFIQNMQHDIRTPTSGLWSVLDSLVNTETNEEKRKVLIILRNSAKRLLDICNDVIDFDRIDRGQIPLTSKKFNIQHTVANIIELNQAAAFKKDLQLNYCIDDNVPLVVKGDQHRLNRILVNLLGNSIKFTHQGYVSIHVRLLKKDNQTVLLQFEVKDSGVGIPQEKKNYIYEKFNRLNPSNQGYYQGSGLGLQIVKRFVSELAGEIDVETKINQGTIFHISLPFEKPLCDEIYDEEPIENNLAALSVDKLVPPQQIPFYTPETTSQACILLIEDDVLARIAALNTLSSTSHYQINVVDSVKSAFTILQQKRFDLVISDLGLPDGSGNDIVRTIKNDPNALNYRTPFVALTAHNDNNNKYAAEQAGFLVTLSKPLIKEQARSLFDLYVNQKSPTTANNEQRLITNKIKEHDIINYDLSRSLVGGNKNLALELIDMLYIELPQDIQIIREAHKKNDSKTLRGALHKLKGGLCYCGVPRLQNAANELHDAVKVTEQLSEITTIFTKFYDEATLFIETHEKLKQ